MRCETITHPHFPSSLLPARSCTGAILTNGDVVARSALRPKNVLKPFLFLLELRFIIQTLKQQIKTKVRQIINPLLSFISTPHQMSLHLHLHRVSCSPLSFEQIQSSQKLIHAVQIDGVLAIQKRRARNNRAKMGFRNEQTEDNRNEQKNIIDKIKRRQQAKLFKPQSDSKATLKARKFLQKIREMKLVEFPKLSFFNEMIRRSYSKERRTNVEWDRNTGRHSSLSRKSIERMVSVDSCELPGIVNPEREGKSETERQYTKLKTLLDRYDGGKKRVRTVN